MKIMNEIISIENNKTLSNYYLTKKTQVVVAYN